MFSRGPRVCVCLNENMFSRGPRVCVCLNMNMFSRGPRVCVCLNASVTAALFLISTLCDLEKEILIILSSIFLAQSVRECLCSCFSVCWSRYFCPVEIPPVQLCVCVRPTHTSERVYVKVFPTPPRSLVCRCLLSVCVCDLCCCVCCLVCVCDVS